MNSALAPAARWSVVQRHHRTRADHVFVDDADSAVRVRTALPWAKATQM